MGLLIRHFGADVVRSSLKRELERQSNTHRIMSRKPSPSTGKQQTTTPVTVALALLRERDAVKYRLLEEFYFRLRRGTILPDSQDIRYFAQLVGIKSIEGKSRKDVIPRLMNQLIDVPIERLSAAIKEAEGISEQQRQRGFSVLTDKLIGEK
jgi:hypothetical protein